MSRTPFSAQWLQGSLVVVDNAFHPASVFFVDSNTGTDSTGYGSTPDLPFATLDYAIGQCTAQKGDVIYVMPKHNETVTGAAGLAVDVSYIHIVGLGHGESRPTITFSTAVGASMVVSAANVTIENLYFKGTLDALTGPISIQAGNVTLRNIRTEDNGSTQAVNWIALTDAAENVVIDGWDHDGHASAGATSALSIDASAGLRLSNFRIWGNFSGGAIVGTNDPTELFIRDGTIQNANAADLAIVMSSTAKGNIGPNLFIRLADDAANITECLVGADINFFDPIMVCNADGERGLQWNGTASADA